MRLALAILVVALCAGTAAAYPQFAITTGSDACTACHFSPAGGGLLNEFGRDEAGSTISSRGDGRFAHGALTPPSWLALGADVRLAAGAKQLEDRAVTGLAFPMQADLYARAVHGGWSLNVTGGLNGAARSRPAGASALNYLISREHYVMYERGAGVSVRVGRFFPVFGLRTQDHTAYTRRYLELSTLEEPYALELGIDEGSWSAHGSAYIGNPWPITGAGPQASGATAYYERQAGNAAIAGQARVAITDADQRYTAGAVARYWLPSKKLLVMGELDVQRQSFSPIGPTRYELVAFASLTRVMLPGYLIGAAVQRWAPDVTLRGATRNALQLDIQVFPWAHVETHLLTRVEATGGDTTHPNLLALLQLHYYL